MKKIVIFGYESLFLDSYAQELRVLFGGMAQVDYLVTGKNDRPTIEADVVVATSPYMNQTFSSMDNPDVGFVIASYTIEKSSFSQILEAQKKHAISVVCEGGLVNSRRRMMMLEKLGARKEAMTAWSEGMDPERLEKYVVAFGHPSLPDRDKRVAIGIDRSHFSIATVLEIALCLEMPEIVTTTTFQRYFKEMCTHYRAFTNDLVVENSLSGDYKKVSSVQEGVLCFSSEFVIEYCDSYIEKITSIPQEHLIGKSLHKIFPFMETLTPADFKEERVVLFNDSHYVVNISINYHHNSQIGLMRMSKYWDEEKRQENLRRQVIHRKHTAKYKFEDIIGVSDAIIECKSIARRIAKAESNVLILGPTGVGKELFAQAIHNSSRRRQFPFIAINCGAIVESLMESELFGYEGGTFTGAKKEGKQGVFELAHKGTLFLDEIGDMPLHLQVRLLRVLQEKEVVRVGGENTIPIDVRIIAATNKDIYRMVKEGTFRNDLFYRLNVLFLKIPPLSERKCDIEFLMQYFMELGHTQIKFSPAALERVVNHPFEGNVRELQNCMEYLFNLNIPEIQEEHLPSYIRSGYSAEPPTPVRKPQEGVIFEGCDSDYRARCVALLRAIDNFNSLGIGIGRRKLKLYFDKQGQFFSEMMIRKLLEDMERMQLVEIHQGRQGTRITERGLRAMKAGETETI
ncbi:MULTISPECIES: sigma-54 interaction domain-containing protein [Anaerotruncus]|uniref:sigma-54 interaction domain-containing protein n=1 Tax=Anaerotruncus TaxID=244127 RepID=UPI000E50C49E|nr:MULTISPECIES: sigma 54-interacting transcriptional regulator [Anaerotruncus]RGX56715.1 AAA family ATPase [Anaerotruncus sp. AF02-27]